MPSIDELNKRREAAYTALLQQPAKDSDAYQKAWREWLAAREDFNDALGRLSLSERLRWDERLETPAAILARRQRSVQAAARLGGIRLLPIAASIIAVIAGGAVGYLGATSGWFNDHARGISRLDDTELTLALSQLASGETRQLTSGLVQVIGTFRQEDGVCRSFVYSEPTRKSDVVACWQGDGWNIAFAAAEPPIRDGEYVPASGESLADTYVARADIGPPLTGGAEQAALEIVGR